MAIKGAVVSKVSHNDGEYMKVILLELWNGNDLLGEKAFILVNSLRSCIEV